MTVETLVNSGIDIQCQVHYVYYDDQKFERVEISQEEANDKEILYMYSEDDEIYFEVDYQNEW